jgi:hypothetical protein
LTTAACGGLRSAPDCRTRRAVLHLSYSYAAPCGPALLVTQGHKRPKPEVAPTTTAFCSSRHRALLTNRKPKRVRKPLYLYFCVDLDDIPLRVAEEKRPVPPGGQVLGWAENLHARCDQLLVTFLDSGRRHADASWMHAEPSTAGPSCHERPGPRGLNVSNPEPTRKLTQLGRSISRGNFITLR